MNTILVQSTPSVRMVGGKLCFTAFINKTEGKLQAKKKKSERKYRQKVSAYKSGKSNA
jgi:hypothetical protein